MSHDEHAARCETIAPYAWQANFRTCSNYATRHLCHAGMSAGSATARAPGGPSDAHGFLGKICVQATTPRLHRAPCAAVACFRHQGDDVSFRAPAGDRATVAARLRCLWVTGYGGLRSMQLQLLHLHMPVKAGRRNPAQFE